MTTIPSHRTSLPKFNIGQDVHLKTGGPEMIVNQNTLVADGNFMVATIWYGDEQVESHGLYQEALLEAKVASPNARHRIRVNHT